MVAGSPPDGPAPLTSARGHGAQPSSCSWRRVTLLTLAITIHNIPGEDLCPSHPSVRESGWRRGGGGCGGGVWPLLELMF